MRVCTASPGPPEPRFVRSWPLLFRVKSWPHGHVRRPPQPLLQHPRPASHPYVLGTRAYPGRATHKHTRCRQQIPTPHMQVPCPRVGHGGCTRAATPWTVAAGANRNALSPGLPTRGHAIPDHPHLLGPFSNSHKQVPSPMSAVACPPAVAPPVGYVEGPRAAVGDQRTHPHVVGVEAGAGRAAKHLQLGADGRVACGGSGQQVNNNQMVDPFCYSVFLVCRYPCVQGGGVWPPAPSAFCTPASATHRPTQLLPEDTAHELLDVILLVGHGDRHVARQGWCATSTGAQTSWGLVLLQALLCMRAAHSFVARPKGSNCRHEHGHSADATNPASNGGLPCIPSCPPTHSPGPPPATQVEVWMDMTPPTYPMPTPPYLQPLPHLRHREAGCELRHCRLGRPRVAHRHLQGMGETCQRGQGQRAARCCKRNMRRCVPHRHLQEAREVCCEASELVESPEQGSDGLQPSEVNSTDRAHAQTRAAPRTRVLH